MPFRFRWNIFLPLVVCLFAAAGCSRCGEAPRYSSRSEQPEAIKAIAAEKSPMQLPKPSALPATAIAGDWAALLQQGTQVSFSPPPELLREGEALSKIHCVACHERPDPSVFPKRAWAEVFTGLLVIFTGNGILDDPQTIALPENPRGIFTAPWKKHRQYRMTNEAFFKTAAYYLHAAPVENLPVVNPPPFSEKPSSFQLKVQVAAPDGGTQPEFTLSAIDERHRRLLLGDKGVLRVFDLSGRPRKALAIPGVPTSISFEPDGVYVTIIGADYIATPEALGQLIRFSYSAFEPGGSSQYNTVLSGLKRPVHAVFADFDSDGVKDILIDEFGVNEGTLGWYSRKPGANTYTHNVLIEGTGALSTAVFDSNQDDRLDILALFSQADETVYRALNSGSGKFKVEPIVRQQPAFGYNAMAIADMNGDGKPDIVTANGDTLPSMPIKHYHGIRILVDDGNGSYDEQYFYPFPGALVVKAGDLDGDGDIDLVSTAFFTDSEGNLTLPLVMLENLGGMKFLPHRLPGGDSGLWVDVGIGDADGDGDKDLLLGASYPTYVKPVWSKSFPPKRTAFQLLENTSQNSADR